MADLSKELNKELSKDFAYCEDTISRQAAIDALMSLTIYKSKREIVQAADKDENSWIGGVAECIDEIEDLPSAQPELRRGEKS